jgi:eukaryotic-like serine/threonine-protein kinase
VPVQGTGVECEDREEGRVDRQSPEAGQQRAVNSEVTYQLCVGPEQVTIPEGIVGSQADAATATLEGLGLTVETEERDDDADAGTVVAVEPEEGSSVAAESTVTLFVSAGNIVPVPNVVDLSEEIATDRLQQAGFEVNVETADGPPDSPDDVGTVAAQDPEAGEERPRDSTVTIVVFPDDDPLQVTVSEPNNGVVTVSWDNGIYGGVTINWGDGTEDNFDGSEDQTQHEYDIPLPGEEALNFTITVTDPDNDGRSESQEITIDPPA